MAVDLSKVKLIIASHNQKKINELINLLSANTASLLYSPTELSEMIVSASSLGLEDPIEDGDTFAKNAVIKVNSVFEQTKIPALADDSGLIVNLLGNAPGVLSARWSGKHGDDLGNNRLLLAQLSDLQGKLRTAHFETAVALKTGENDTFIESGQMHGVIIDEMRGENGFGYDSIFVPNAYLGTEYDGLTTAQLASDLKDAISHRGQAIRQMLPRIINLLQ